MYLIFYRYSRTGFAGYTVERCDDCHAKLVAAGHTDCHCQHVELQGACQSLWHGGAK